MALIPCSVYSRSKNFDQEGVLVRTLWAVNIRVTHVPFIGKLTRNHIAKRILGDVAPSLRRE